MYSVYLHHSTCIQSILGIVCSECVSIFGPPKLPYISTQMSSRFIHQVCYNNIISEMFHESSQIYDKKSPDRRTGNMCALPSIAQSLADPCVQVLISPLLHPYRRSYLQSVPLMKYIHQKPPSYQPRPANLGFINTSRRKCV